MANIGGTSQLLPHLVWEAWGGWAPGAVLDHARVNFTVEVCQQPYRDYGVPIPTSTCLVENAGLVDSGAQMCVGGMDLLYKLEVGIKELVKPELRISAADNAGLQVLGAMFILITGAGGVRTGQMVYITELFLSQAACLDLGVVGPRFPTVG